MSNLIKRLFIKIDLLVQAVVAILQSVPTEVKLNVQYSPADTGNCGIASADMIIKFLGGSPLADFDSYKTPSSYIENIGWVHQGLVDIIEGNSELNAKAFRYRSYRYVINKLSQGLPVIVSVRVPSPDNLSQETVYGKSDENGNLENHMVICVGYNQRSIYVNDPRDIGIYSKDLEVPRELFARLFNGNGIIVESSTAN